MIRRHSTSLTKESQFVSNNIYANVLVVRAVTASLATKVISLQLMYNKRNHRINK